MQLDPSNMYKEEERIFNASASITFGFFSLIRVLTTFAVGCEVAMPGPNAKG